jgi:hypothetical protein
MEVKVPLKCAEVLIKFTFNHYSTFGLYFFSKRCQSRELPECSKEFLYSQSKSDLNFSKIQLHLEYMNSQ